MSEYEIRMWAIEQAVESGADAFNVTQYATEFVAFVFPAPENRAPNPIGEADASA